MQTKTVTAEIVNDNEPGLGDKEFRMRRVRKKDYKIYASKPPSYQVYEDVVVQPDTSDVDRANNLHRLIVTLDNTSHENKLELGQWLQIKKEEVGHGNWVNWVNENLEFTERTAQRYIKYFEEKKELEIRHLVVFEEKASQVLPANSYTVVQKPEGENSSQELEKKAEIQEQGQAKLIETPKRKPVRSDGGGNKREVNPVPPARPTINLDEEERFVVEQEARKLGISYQDVLKICIREHFKL